MRMGPLAEVTSWEVGVKATNPSGMRKAYNPPFANFAESFYVRFSRTASPPFSSVNTGCLCWVRWNRTGTVRKSRLEVGTFLWVGVIMELMPQLRLGHVEHSQASWELGNPKHKDGWGVGDCSIWQPWMTDDLNYSLELNAKICQVRYRREMVWIRLLVVKSTYDMFYMSFARILKLLENWMSNSSVSLELPTVIFLPF